VDTADRPVAAAATAGLRRVDLLPAAADTADRLLAAVDMADLPAADLRLVVTADLLRVDLRVMADLPDTVDLRAHRPACTSLRASAVRWVPAATCLR
jgi:hypothetical protein